MECTVNIYDDIGNFDFGNELEKLEIEKRNLQTEIETLENEIKRLNEIVFHLKNVKENLTKNISELFKTAQCEIGRKNKVIVELREQVEQFKSARIFKKNNNKKRPLVECVNSDVEDREENSDYKRKKYDESPRSNNDCIKFSRHFSYDRNYGHDKHRVDTKYPHHQLDKRDVSRKFDTREQSMRNTWKDESWERSKSKEGSSERTKSMERCWDRSNSKEGSSERAQSWVRTKPKDGNPDKTKSMEQSWVKSESKEGNSDKIKSKEGSSERSKSKEERNKSKEESSSKERSKSNEDSSERSKSKGGSSERTKSKEGSSERSKSKGGSSEKHKSKEGSSERSTTKKKSSKRSDSKHERDSKDERNEKMVTPKGEKKSEIESIKVEIKREISTKIEDGKEIRNTISTDNERKSLIESKEVNIIKSVEESSEAKQDSKEKSPSTSKTTDYEKSPIKTVQNDDKIETSKMVIEDEQNNIEKLSDEPVQKNCSIITKDSSEQKSPNKEDETKSSTKELQKEDIPDKNNDTNSIISGDTNVEKIPQNSPEPEPIDFSKKQEIEIVEKTSLPNLTPVDMDVEVIPEEITPTKLLPKNRRKNTKPKLIQRSPRQNSIKPENKEPIQLFGNQLDKPDDVIAPPLPPDEPVFKPPEPKSEDKPLKNFENLLLQKPNNEEKPLKNFENLLLANEEKFKLAQEMHGLHLTHEGEIPVLHLDENNFMLPGNPNYVQDKNLFSLITSIKELESELPKFKSTSEQEEKELTKNVDNSLSFSNCLDKISPLTSTPKNDFVKQNNENINSSNVNKEINCSSSNETNTLQTSNQSTDSQSAARRRRRRCVIVMND